MDDRYSCERTRLLPGFRLAEWTVRPEDGSVSSPAASSRLEPLLMDLLVFLCTRAGQVVPKQDILDAVWGGRFVSDETVKGSFYQLRKALADNPKQPWLIETLPKRGYRVLVAPVPLDERAGAMENEAQEMLLKGRQLLAGQPNGDALKQARLYFERSAEADPQSAEALSSLAHTYVLTAMLGLGRSSEFLPRARTAATRASELDPKLAEAHVALGVVRFAEEHDFASAENEFRTAIALRPRDSAAHRWYARFLSSQSRHDEAVAEARRALECDPLSLPARRDLIETLFMARRYGDAIAEAHQLCDIAPQSAQIQLGMVWVYYLNRQEREAFESFKAGVTSLGVSPAMVQQAQAVFDRAGMPEVLRQWLALLEQQAALGQKNHVDRIVLYALLGEAERCFSLMELALEEGYPYLLALPVSPVFDNLRRDPRYSQFMKRLGFAFPV